MPEPAHSAAFPIVPSSPPARHVLVLAQTPPPFHGQSAMVRTLLDGLAGRTAALVLHHVELRLSHDTADIGRWRPGKIFAVLAAIARAWRLFLRHGPMDLYYVPAPGGKRGAFYRDWLAMLACRPFCARLILHWHATGLGQWLATAAAGPERFISHLLLDGADVAIVLGEALRSDAEKFKPRRIEIIRNGIVDPCPGWVRPPRAAGPFRVLFLGHGSEAKGLRRASAGVEEANRRASATAFTLTFAGEFADDAMRRWWDLLPKDQFHALGFVAGEAKTRAFAATDALIFPTTYAAETQGLVVAEALAHDLPVIVTRWAAVAENLPTGHAEIVAPPGSPEDLAAALLRLAAAPPPNGACRRHFLAHYTVDTFLDRVAAIFEARC